jgi:yersiniabactin nonribosomal peptide synthetase
MASHDELERKRARLSPEQRALLQKRLQGTAAPVAAARAAPRPQGRAVFTSGRAPRAVEVSFAELVSAGAERAAELPLAPGVGFFELSPGMNNLAVAHIRRAVGELRLFTRIGERRSVQEIIDDFGVPPANRKLMRRCLQSLAERGWLSGDSDSFVYERPFAEGSVEDRRGLIDEVEARVVRAAQGTPYEPIVRAQAAVGIQLAGILRGEVNAAETFFAESSRVPDIAYTDTWEARYCLSVVARIVETLVAREPADRSLQILELGAGVGATTRAVLPLLPAARTSYLVTDVSSYFLDQASAAFAGNAMVHFDLLNIDDPPGRVGYAAGAFDLVLATNVLHCARMLDKSLEYVRWLLKPGGLLLAVEATQNETWHQTTMGLLTGGMSFEDARLDRNVLFLSAGEWQTALRAAGFRQVASLPGDEARGQIAGQHVVLALS